MKQLKSSVFAFSFSCFGLLAVNASASGDIAGKAGWDESADPASPVYDRLELKDHETVLVDDIDSQGAAREVVEGFEDGVDRSESEVGDGIDAAAGGQS